MTNNKNWKWTLLINDRQTFENSLYFPGFPWDKNNSMSITGFPDFFPILPLFKWLIFCGYRKYTNKIFKTLDIPEKEDIVQFNICQWKQVFSLCTILLSGTAFYVSKHKEGKYKEGKFRTLLIDERARHFFKSVTCKHAKKILPFVVELTKQGRDCETKETLHFDVK